MVSLWLLLVLVSCPLLREGMVGLGLWGLRLLGLPDKVATCSLVLAGDVVAWVSRVLVGWGVSHLAVVAALEGCFPADVVGGGDRSFN